MNRSAVLAAFDDQLRRDPRPALPDEHIERDGPVVRSVGAGWSGVTWSDLRRVDADAVIAAQIDRFARLRRSWEWKHYSHDLPPDLPDRLLAAGFTRQDPETLLVAEISALPRDVAPPEGVRLRTVRTARDIEAYVSVHDAVFGGDHRAVGVALRAGLARHPAMVAAVLAVAGGTPVAAGRLELHAGTDFASLWGGGTLPAWRGRGVFRALVAHRAAVASAEGFRYLQVDATPASRPILERLGFVELATTTPFTHPGGAR
jgi:ribosomal protein S18 acetylase RimI-like enzyme